MNSREHSIKNQWTETAFSELAEFRNGINFSKSQKGENGVLTIDVRNMFGPGVTVDIGNLYRVSKKISADLYLQPADILFVRSSLKLEGVGWNSMFVGFLEPVSFCGFIIRARLRKGAPIDPLYLTYFCRSDAARQKLIAGSGKVAITNISQDVLATLQIPIPPLPEQRKIAGVLGVVQRAIEQQERLLALTAELKKALLHKLFTEGLRGEPQKQTEIGLVPESWDVEQLGGLVEDTQQVNMRSEGEREIRYIDVSSISREFLQIEATTRHLLKDAPGRARKKVKTGDVIFATVRPTLLRLARVPPEYDDHVCSTAFCVLRDKNKSTLGRFLYYLTQRERFVKQPLNRELATRR